MISARLEFRLLPKVVDGQNILPSFPTDRLAFVHSSPSFGRSLSLSVLPGVTERTNFLPNFFLLDEQVLFAPPSLSLSLHITSFATAMHCSAGREGGGGGN